MWSPWGSRFEESGYASLAASGSDVEHSDIEP